MTEPAAPPARPPSSATEAEIDEVLAEFGGDPRKAIAALMHDVKALAADYETSVSRGFVRSEFAPGRRRRRA